MRRYTCCRFPGHSAAAAATVSLNLFFHMTPELQVARCCVRSASTANPRCPRRAVPPPLLHLLHFLFLCLVLFISLIYLNVSYVEGQGRRIVSAAAVAELYYPTATSDLHIQDVNPRAPQCFPPHPVPPLKTSSHASLQWTHAEAMMRRCQRSRAVRLT
jgi:hypothetical protein